MADLELRHVSKSYDGRQLAVDDISLEVPDGSTLTILGPSGCGKSTLLRLIAGLERPLAGEVLLDGTRVTHLEPRDRDVAMVFQSYALYPHLRVFDNIAVALRLRRMSSDDIAARVGEAAERLGIVPLLRRRPRELSGGERQRVALARALVREPRVFLLDEPLSNLDALLRERARGELRILFAQLKATVVYVTHDQVEAMSLCDRMAVMRQGRLEQLGRPEEIYARPNTSFVASFVGSPHMNLVPGAMLSVSAPTAGIRPEDLRLDATGPLEMEVLLDEPLGAQRLLRLRRGELDLRLLTPSAGERHLGRRVRVSWDQDKLHRFDAAGRRLTSDT